MATSVAQKLKIREGMKLLTVNAPAGFERKLEPAPRKLEISSGLKDFNQIHWFVKSQTEMEKQLDRILNLMKDDVVCWIYYPKGTSGIQTDLTRDKGWEKLESQQHLQWISLISFDDTWSSFGMRLKTAADEKKESKPRERPIFDFIDAKKKIIRLPDDLARALKKSRKASDFFETLSFTNKKEYVEWIVTAKRDETRLERIKGTVERLEKKWKNPRNL